MPLGIGQDLQEDPPRRGIPLTDLAYQCRVRYNLLPFEHEVLNDHLP
jgi:hypothetical protein